ncbi:MAG: sugar phosphate isomerase/epimerase [Ruminococcaceae bacterium]|nr:sugar phosphate isomerase/epimerase [Oscillospiraceae bacterium]
MKDFLLGIQLYSVRDDLEKDFEGTLKKIKAMGYDGVEFAGLYGNCPCKIKKICAELDLIPISAHVPFAEMIENPEVLKDYAEIGCKFVVIPYLTEEYRPGNEKFGEVIEGAKLLGTKANELGMKLCYHNHDFEFVKLNGEYALDILYKEVSADLLQTEIDTCWVNVGGENPAEYVKKYAGRAEIVHLKDFNGGKSENMYALIGIDEEAKEEAENANKFEFRPVGYGVQNFPAILEASKEAGAKWVIVEQDEPSMGKSRMECAEMSINYLNTL